MKNPKIIGSAHVSKLLVALKKRRKRIVFTNGCFDLMHAGHVRYLRKARALGDVLVVGLNTDASVSKLKGPGRPLAKLAHRAEVLSGLSAVDYVIPFAEQTPEKLIRRLQPDVLVKGADYRQDQIAGAAFVKKNGGRVVRIGMLQGLSTSALIRRIQAAAQRS